MNLARVGRSLRVLRRRRRLRQSDVARAAGLSQSAVSRIELGMIDGVTVTTLDRLATALGARLDLGVRWNGEDLDRLLDASHAHLVEKIVSWLRRWGWLVETEVSFNVFGERGSIDVLAWWPDTNVLAVFEAKSVVPDIQATLSTLDRKHRLARAIVRDRGWRPSSVSRVLVVTESRTARRRVDEHSAIFDAALPTRGIALRKWLRDPSGSNGGRRESTRSASGPGPASSAPGPGRVGSSGSGSGPAQTASGHNPAASPVAGLWFLSVTHPTGPRQDVGSGRRVHRVRSCVGAAVEGGSAAEFGCQSPATTHRAGR